jgi:hypothetical protein
MIYFLIATLDLYLNWQDIRPSPDTPTDCKLWNIPRFPNRLDPWEYHTLNPTRELAAWWIVEHPCDTPPIVVWWKAIITVCCILLFLALLKLK